MIEVLLILIALALVVACGAFVAAEFAFVTVDRGVGRPRRRERRPRRAAACSARCAALSTQLSARAGRDHGHQPADRLPRRAVDRAAWSTGRSSPLGVPEGAVHGRRARDRARARDRRDDGLRRARARRTSRSREPLATARAVQGFMRGFTRATGPIVRVLQRHRERDPAPASAIEPQEELASARSPEELASLVRRSAEQGTLERGTAALLQRSLAFGERRAHEIMTPRGRVATVRRGRRRCAPSIEQARESGRSRFPVVGEGRARSSASCTSSTPSRAVRARAATCRSPR